MVGSSVRRQLHVSTNISTGVPSQYLALTWIEGIGEKAYGLHSIFVPDLYNGFSFCGVYNDTAYVYIANLNCYQLTAAKELPEAERMKVYPVPASNLLTVQNKSRHISNDYDLVDISGRVYRGAFSGPERNNIDLRPFADGVYLLVVYDDAGNTYKQKVVKR
jgi:hypothetical protein